MQRLRIAAASQADSLPFAAVPWARLKEAGESRPFVEARAARFDSAAMQLNDALNQGEAHESAPFGPFEARRLVACRFKDMGQCREYDIATATLERTPGHDRLYGFETPVAIWDDVTLLERVHPDDRPNIRTRLLAARIPGADLEGWESDFRIILPTGEVRWLHLVARFVRNEVGVVVKHRGALVDVTGVRRAHERVTEAEIVGRAAQESSRLKSQFVAMVSHELRTPLGGIIGLSDLLLESSLDGTQRGLTENLKRSGEALLRVISDILDISMIEAGKIAFESVEFAPEQVVDDVCLLMRLEAERKGLSFEASLEVLRGRRFLGDPTRLRQVLSNLLGNAVKFTKKGSVTLRVEERPGGAQRTAFRFVVSDTGIGMDESLRARLFLPFSQGDNSSSRQFEGTGPGLFIARSLAEGMGGSVVAQSAEGLGSSFTLDLPFALPPVSSTSSVPSVPSVPPRAGGRGERVLVVDDIEVNRMVLGLMLESLGYVPLLVAGGDEALAALETDLGRDVVAILMDCRMPGLDGLDTTRLIRSNPRLSEQLRNLPIIALTAGTLEEDRTACLAAGMDDHASKPLRKDELAALLARWRERGEVWHDRA
jgi:signal transduction histidine kinase/CheY-like chemotaxis protein